MKHIQYLAGEIGPRGSTSKEEKQAADYVVEFLHSQGVEEVDQQVFRSPTTWAWTNFIADLIVLLGIATYFFYPLFGAFFSGIGLLFNILENDNRLTLSRLMPKQQSQNIIGTIRPSNQVKNKVVLVAHIDSARADSAHHPARVASFRGMFLLNIAFPILIFLVCFIGVLLDFGGVLLASYRIDWLILILLALPVLYIMVLLILKQFRYDLVPGANDNASGVAVVLELMTHFVKEPLKHTEVLAVLVGSEEVNCNGMINYLDQYGHNLRNAYFINIDNIGAGTPFYATVEGMLFSRKPHPDLLMLAQKVQREYPELNVEERTWRAGYTDGSAAMVRGYKVLSFLAVGDNGVPPNWHWYTDVPDNIQEENLATVETFIKKMIYTFDSSYIDSL
jgi:hypothetical protein